MKRWIITLVLAGTGFILCRDAAMLVAAEKIPSRRDPAVLVQNFDRP